MAWLLKRQAARVILLSRPAPDSEDPVKIFLIRAIDPADRTKPAWWEIPGGGIDPGEASDAAVARELAEEAGQHKAEIGPVVFTQYVEFSFGGYDFEQDEVLHVAWTETTEINKPEGLEYLEALAFQEARWWTLEEVLATDEPFLPASLPHLLPRLVAGDLPNPPIDISPEPTNEA